MAYLPFPQPVHRLLELISPLDALFTPLDGGTWIAPTNAVLCACDVEDFQAILDWRPVVDHRAHAAASAAAGAVASPIAAGSPPKAAPDTATRCIVAVAHAMLDENVPVVPVPPWLTKLFADCGCGKAQASFKTHIFACSSAPVSSSTGWLLRVGQLTPLLVRTHFRLPEAHWSRTFGWEELAARHPALASMDTVGTLLSYCAQGLQGAPQL